MSGAEAITAIQLIDACIGIANTIIEIGRAVYDAQGLPPKLRELLEKLPAIQELLESAQESCEERRITEVASKNAQPILEHCKAALADLKEIFRKACPKDGENRAKRIWRGTKTVFFGRDSQVQKLLVDIQADLELLEQKEIYVIGNKLDALKQVTEALANGEDGKYSHTGAGNIIANEGGSPTNNVVGGSNNRQIINPGVYNEGPSTHNYTYLPQERPETPPKPSSNVPFRRDPDFVDRGTLLDQLRKRCAAPASRVALVGLGGVGKSQLAIEHCYRTAEQSPETWVFWAHASNPARLEQSFREIADHVKIRGRKDAQADVFKLVYDWLRNEKNGRWLLVLDNADDAAVLSPPPRNSQTSPTDGCADDSGGAVSTSTSGLQRHLSKYLPPSRHGSVLTTSRTRRAAIQIVEDSDVILIEPMHDTAAYALLYKKLGDKVDKSDGIAELAAALGYMPLALVQAAAYIRERAPRSSVRQYLVEYCENDSRKTSLLNQAAGHLRRDETASNSVLLTWQISFDHIRRSRRSAAELLSLMSFFDRQGIQEALLRNPSGTTEDHSFEDDVLTLRDYSFITITKEANTFEMHNLVQLATRTWLGNQGQLDRWRERFISNLCAEMPAGQYEKWQKCEELFPHARAALAHRPQNKESLKEWALLLYKAARYASERGRAGEAEHMSTVSMKVRREVCGEDGADTLRSMELIGQARERGGRWKEAEAMNRQTLALKETVLGREHPETLTSMSNLALVLGSQGKHEEAEAMNRQTLALYQTVLGREHPSTLTSMSNLALVLGRQGKHEDAEAMNRQTLALKETVLRREHPETLASMNNLAGVLESQGKYEEAEAMNRQTLALYQTVLGREHPSTLTSMSNLALMLGRQGKYKDAEAMNRQTLALKETVLRREHPETLASMSNLALVLGSQGKHEDAEVINRQTLALYQTVLGREHPSTLTSMSNLALVLESQGKYKDAEATNRQTLALYQTVLGREHPETLTSINNLAHLLEKLCCYNESFALYERACAGYYAVFGEDHPTTRMCRQHYATARMNATKGQTSNSWYKKFREMFR